MVSTRQFHEDEFLMMVTRKGTVKRIPFLSLKTNRKSGIRAITLEEDDHLINVIRTDGSDNILLATAQGMAICFCETDVRPMGRSAAGVRGIQLGDDDFVVGADGSDNILLATAQGMAICFCETDVRPMGRSAAGVRGIQLGDDDFVVGAEKAEEGKTLLTVTVNGYGKRTELSEYLRTGPDGEKVPQSRGGKGLKNYNITSKTGNVAGCRVVGEQDDNVAGCRVVGEQDDVMLIENGGVIIRIPAASINVYKRDVQGVIVMRIEEGNQVVSLERVESLDEEEATEEQA